MHTVKKSSITMDVMLVL